MNKVKFILVVFSIIIISCKGSVNKSSDLGDLKIKGNVSWLTEISSAGDTIQYYFNRQGNVTFYTETIGNKIRTEDYSYSGDFLKKECIQKEYFREGKDTIFKNDFYYYDNDNLLYLGYSYKGKDTTRYELTRDNLDREIELRAYLNNELEMIKKTNYIDEFTIKYNVDYVDLGTSLKARYAFNSDSTKLSVTFSNGESLYKEFNKNNDVVFEYSNDQENIATYEYTYDLKLNWIKQIRYSSTDTIEKIRVYQYY